MAEYHSAPPLDYNTILEMFAKAKAPMRYVDTFLPADQFEQTISGSASITAYTNALKLETGTTSGSYAKVLSALRGFSSARSWDKKRILQIQLDIIEHTNQIIHLVSGDIKDVTSSANTDRHIGFKVVDNTLYATVADGSTEKTASIGTFSLPITYKLLVILTPGQKAEFYVGDELKATITENLPSGTADADKMFTISLYNSAAENKEIMINWLKVVQLE